jgi:ABC-2 type transport system permease protein
VGLTAAIVTMVFTRTFVEHAFLTSAILLLVSVVSALAGFINGIFATTLEQVNSVATFVLTPLTYLNGNAVKSKVTIRDDCAIKHEPI